MTTPFPPACVFLCDVDRGLFLNPRINRVGLPVQEHPRVRLGSNITLKYILVRGGVALAIPSGTLITVSLSDRDPQLSPRPFYNAPAVAVSGETGAVLASYDLSSPEMAGFRTGPIWFSIFVNDTAVLVDRGVLESGAWSYPLPATPFQETVVEIGEGGTIALRPTPTIYVTDEVVAEDESRTIAVSNAALAEDTFYDCNRLLIKVLSETGAELLFPGADYIIGSAWRAGWWLCKIRQYPDSTVGVEIGSAESPGSGFTDVSDLTDTTGLLFSGDYDDLDNKPTIPTDVNQLIDSTGILSAKENVANKTQAIDAVTPSADKYTSEAAVVAHVAGLIPDVPEDISELTDTTGILAGKVDVDGEKVLSDNNYTDADAAIVADAVTSTGLGLDTETGDITKFLNQKQEWATPSAGDVLPAVTANDDGDVLTVVDGGWDKAAAPVSATAANVQSALSIDTVAGLETKVLSQKGGFVDLPTVTGYSAGTGIDITEGAIGIDTAGAAVGQVLKRTESGVAWSSDSEGDTLPAVTTEDNGDILAVVAGVWDKADAPVSATTANVQSALSIDTADGLETKVLSEKGTFVDLPVATTYSAGTGIDITDGAIGIDVTSATTGQVLKKTELGVAWDAIPAAAEGARGTIALATAAEAAAGVDAGKAITPATLKPLVDAKENVANKTQAIDAVTPSADKYTSEAAVVDYVAGAVTDAMGDIEAALDALIGGA